MTPMSSEHARILVVDDNEAARYAVVRALRSEDHEVLEGATGRAALDLSRRARPDLLVLDVRLPDIMGFEVTEELRSDPVTRAMPILQVSASFTAADAQAQGLRRGADAYLTHPIETQVLLATVDALLRMRAAEQCAQAERERAEASERRHRFLADMLPQLVWSADAQGRPDYFNQRWYEFVGSEQPQTQDWIGTIHPDDQARFQAAWRRAVDAGEPLEVEYRRWHLATQAYRWLLARAMPMRNTNGTVVRWFGTSTDIEGHKQAAIEHERLMEEAQSSAAERDKLVERLRDEARRKNEFIAMLSHELRNPLAPIRNSLYIIEHSERESERFRRAIAVIDRQTQQMSRLVDDLLDVARITRGKIHLQREPVDLNVLVRRAAEDHRGSFKRLGVDFDVETTDASLCVDGDPARLSQVIGNLLQNAAKFTPSGGRVALSLGQGSSADAEIRVRDSGVGISAEILAHIFEPFVQGEHTIDRSNGGLGLGLALAHGIVHLHGGSITASSEGQGCGAEFVVRLPLAVEDNAEPRRIHHVQAKSDALRVLVIEDLKDAAESLKEALDLAGHVAVVAFDAPSGLALARTFLPHVVLCDLGLPGMDGFEVARAMRGDPELCSAFLVALSGYASSADVDRCKQAGFNEHMAKPARLDSLEALLAGVSKRFGTRR